MTIGGGRGLGPVHLRKFPVGAFSRRCMYFGSGLAKAPVHVDGVMSLSEPSGLRGELNDLDRQLQACGQKTKNLDKRIAASKTT